jgi:hypothetical protein
LREQLLLPKLGELSRDGSTRVCLGDKVREPGIAPGTPIDDLCKEVSRHA